jgi:hypothetical protein
MGNRRKADDMTKKRKKLLDPFSEEIHRRVIEKTKKMTPEEALAALTYRDPNVPVTDMLGIFGLYDNKDKSASMTEKTSAGNLRDAA